MGQHCCVPGCKSNYQSNSSVGHITTFSFPNDPVKKNKWLSAIHREENFQVTKHFCVCIKHFTDRHFIKEDSMQRADGTFLVLPRKIPKLTEDAFSTIFPNLPSYLSDTLPPKRKNPEERRKSLDNRSEALFEQWTEKDIIASFNDFCSYFLQKDLRGFNFKIVEDQCVFFYKVELSPDLLFPKISVGLKILKNLAIEVFFHLNDSLTKLCNSKFKWILGDHFLCDTWSKFENLISHFNNYQEKEGKKEIISDFNLVSSIKSACDIIQNCLEYLSSNC